MTGPRSSAPVPATTLDVEACVRLLNEVILWISPHDEQSIADANQLRALASALPGMGKDAERWRVVGPTLALCSASPSGGYYLTGGDFLDAPIPRSPDEFADRLIAARAAQPEETSADAET